MSKPVTATCPLSQRAPRHPATQGQKGGSRKHTIFFVQLGPWDRLIQPADNSD